MKKDLQFMINNASTGMVIFSEKGQVAWHNDSALDLLDLNGSFESVGQLPQPIQHIFSKCVSESTGQLRIGTLRLHLERNRENGESHILMTVFDDPEYFELEQIIQKSFDEILVTNKNGVITKINARCEEIYGLPADEIVGKNTTDLEQKNVFNPSLMPIVQKEKQKVSTVQVTQTGKRLYVIGNPVFDEEGNIYRVIFNSREVSEVEALESQLNETEDLLNKYKTELNQLKQLVSDEKELIYQSQEMNQVYQLAERVAQADSTVLISGETGVGKGMMARFIHQQSHRRNNKIIEINCGAIPANLIESELFGYERGAFTGAKKEGKKGMIELADQGTLFLDEIGELPLNVQVKLLQFLQDNSFRRVGGNDPIHVDTRIIAATNEDLPEQVKEKNFREDLYYRLNVIPIMIPPLRHRKEDIPILIDTNLTRLNSKYQTNKKICDRVCEQLFHYEWPGNVRELENLIERLFVTSGSKMIMVDDLPDDITRQDSSANGIVVKDIFPLKEAVENLERQLLTMTYQTYKNTYKCAEVLQVNQSTVARKMKKYGCATE